MPTDVEYQLELLGRLFDRHASAVSAQSVIDGHVGDHGATSPATSNDIPLRKNTLPSARQPRRRRRQTLALCAVGIAVAAAGTIALSRLGNLADENQAHVSAANPPSPATDPPPTAPPFVATPPIVALGDPIGMLAMSKLDKVSIVLAGQRDEELKEGVGHLPGTPMPGEFGNAVIAGHRTTYGAPFGDLDLLEVGDRIVIESLQGHFEYRVVEQHVTDAADQSVLANVPDKRMLTLITCHPKFTSQLRLVVTAILVEAGSDPVPEQAVAYLDPEAASASVGSCGITPTG
jgi:LPXTG-site transpeptidase (sortase) family protein